MRFAYVTILFILIFNCSKSGKNRSELIHFVPENTSVIFQTSNIESLKNSVHNSDFFQKLSNIDFYSSLEARLENLSHLKPTSNLLICASENESDSLDYTIITKYNRQLLITDSIPDYSEETIPFGNYSIKKSVLNGSIFYSTIIDSTFFASSSKKIVENVFSGRYSNIELEKVYQTANPDKSLSIILNANQPFVETIFIEDSLKLKRFTQYLAVDIDIDQNELFVNGITKASDSTESLINIFKNTVPQENQTQNIAPANSDGFMSFTFDDFAVFGENLKKFQKDSNENDSELFDNIIEVGVIYEDNDKAIILNSLDAVATKDALLGEQDRIDTYRQTDIFNFGKPHLFNHVFSPLVSFNDATRYCIVDHFFVFANSTEMLQNIIANYQNKTTYGERSYFKDIMRQLSDESSLLTVTGSDALNTVLNRSISEKVEFKLDAYKASAVQFIYDHNFAHVNAIIKKAKPKSSRNSISEVLNIKLDKDLLNTPQFVVNHITRQKEIVVQDIDNNLYLISNRGKILWKKKLHGPILGNIKQIDIYKNGRLQLAFATPKRLYVLDRNGRNVGPFPRTFNDDITQPLSVFDYDKTKNYRLMVTQGRRVLMYNTQANIVRGFTFKSANGIILSQPKHFRIGRKDYIVLKTENRLYILDRTGKNRVLPKTSNSFSSEDIFVYKNKFTTTTSNGKLISVDTRGNTATADLNMGENHHVVTTSKTLVTLFENKLGIKTKTVELEYGNYSRPRIFYINDKIYVSLTDLQSQKVYVFDSQGKSIPNFPVYGNSEISLDNIDKDNNLEFITKGESNALILYQIN